MKNVLLKNYVEVNHSYCHYLKEETRKIKNLCFSRYTTIDDCKKVIGGIIKPAKWTEKKVWFNKTMNEIKDKKQLYFLVYNSINKAERTLVEVKN